MIDAIQGVSSLSPAQQSAVDAAVIATDPSGQLNYEIMVKTFNVPSTHVTILSDTDNNYSTFMNNTNLVLGGAGNDTMSGWEFSDVYAGGAGNDTLSGGNGDDVLHGGSGNDTITGGAGVDVMRGGADNEIDDVIDATMMPVWMMGAYALQHSGSAVWR